MRIRKLTDRAAALCLLLLMLLGLCPFAAAETAPDGEAEIPTDLALTGAAYGRERAGGFVASDFLYAYSSDLLTVQVEDRLYAINDGIMVSIDID